MELPASSILAWLVAVTVAVVLLRWIINDFHGPKLQRAGAYVGAIVAAYIAQLAFRFGLAFIPALGQRGDSGRPSENGHFRGRAYLHHACPPQGIFAHHEFSWSWVKKLFKRGDVPQTAVSA